MNNRFFTFRRDGGPLSKVWGFFLVELKKRFTVALLHFENGSRDNYHSHAFNGVGWLFKGRLTEYELNGKVNTYGPSFRPIRTPREMFHKVVSDGDTWVLAFRGAWADTWQEYDPNTLEFSTLTHGRNTCPSDAVP